MAASSEARIWKMVLAYDGSDFHGWQVQPDQPTIQGELRAAIARVTGEEVLPQGSGRTDAGVHALAQVVSFALAAPIPEANLVRALNRTLPAAIRVRSACLAPAGFHARHSAAAKTYEYHIYRGEISPPWLARYVYALDQRLDCAAMQRAAERVLGEHDFTSFAATDPDLSERSGAGISQFAEEGHHGDEPPPAALAITPQSNVRTLSISEWLVSTPALNQPGAGSSAAQFFDPCNREFNRGNADFLTYRVRGNGFLHHMVRNLVGTFLEIGRGNLTAADLPRILEARARSQAGPTAPARGLFLVRVDYPEDLT
jgi:tRNA pseudouridine38-40 synthase